MEEHKEVPALILDNEEAEAYAYDVELLNGIKEERGRAYDELDGMTINEYYESNRKKDLSFIPPRGRNRQEKRIVTGTTREKDSTLLSTLLNLNLEPAITAFDDDSLIASELGVNMRDLVKRSREIENYDKKRPLMYREMISQGDVYIEEQFVDDFRQMPVGEVHWNPLKDGVAKLSFTERLKNLMSYCSTRMIDPRMVYEGSMRIEYIEDQDMVAVANIMKRGEAKKKYGEWERWKNVPYQIDSNKGFELGTDGKMYKNWAMFSTKNSEVSEVFFYKKNENRFQIYLNGIPMLPFNFPLTVLYPDGDLPLVQGKLEPIAGFSRSKSLPSKTKVDQEVLDEATRLMIEGMQQSRKPPLGHSGKRAYGKNIFLAGTVTAGIPKDTFHSLLPAEALGLNSADFSFYKMFKENINEKTTNEVYGGSSQQGINTLGQAEMMKEQQLLKLGHALDGVTNMEKRMVALRIPNILYNWIAPVNSDVEETREGVLEQVNDYRKISVNTTIEDGGEGLKVFRFSDRDFDDMTDEELYQEEEELSKKQEKAVRVVRWNPESIRKKKFKWFIEINPTSKSNDNLKQLMFMQNVERAMSIFGPEALNFEYLKQRFAIVTNEDYTKFFNTPSVMEMLQNQNAMGGNRDMGGSNSQPRRETNTEPLELTME